MSDIDEIKKETKTILDAFLARVPFSPKDVFVLGISTSEIGGGQIGKDSNPALGKAVIEVVADTLRARDIFLAVQGCEHINRALVIEREAAERYGFEVVSVVPAIDAGGGGAVAWYELAKDPVVVEFIKARGGIDIGDTSIGMHVRHVQVPVRLPQTTIGRAHVTCLGSRPKLIGGARARYGSLEEKR